MNRLHAIAFGGFLLILAYLALKNKEGVGAVATGIKLTSIDEIKALQGRAVAYH